MMMIMKIKTICDVINKSRIKVTVVMSSPEMLEIKPHWWIPFGFPGKKWIPFITYNSGFLHTN